MIDDFSSAESPSLRAKGRRRRRRLTIRRVATLLTVATLFLVAVVFAARYAVHLAKQGALGEGVAAGSPSDSVGMRIGSDSEPIYLASTSGAIRRFFAQFPTPEAREAVNLESLDIRRILGQLEARQIDSEADTIQFRILSGPIEGGVYWLHHTDLPEDSVIDPIISPIPVTTP